MTTETRQMTVMGSLHMRFEFKWNGLCLQFIRYGKDAGERECARTHNIHLSLFDKDDWKKEVTLNLIGVAGATTKVINQAIEFVLQAE
jgi:hypothetical protein